MSAMVAVQQSGETFGVVSNVPHLRAQPAMTGQFLVEFFKDQDGEGKARLHVLVDTLAPLSKEERDDALKAYKKANQVPSTKKDGKTVTDPVASTRASEIKALWAALALAQVQRDEIASLGYHKAVAFARATLNDLKIDPDGDKVPTKEERIAARKTRVQSKVMDESLEQARAENPQQAGESLGQYLQRITPIAEQKAVKVQAEVVSERASAIVKSLIEKEQPDVLRIVAMLLADQIK